MGIKELRIKNFLLIDELNIEFGENFNVFTGETGAGKSMVAGSLLYLFGEKIDWEIFKDEKEIEIEGIFSAPFHLKNRFEENGIPFEDEIYIKRIIIPSKKVSRFYLNGVMVPLSLLKNLVGDLFDFHGQHEHQSLLNEETHLYFLDAFAGISGEREKLSEILKEYRKLKMEYEKEKEEILKLKEMEDYIKFQIEEVERLNIKEGEDKELERELSFLSKKEDILKRITYSLNLLYEDDYSIGFYLKEILKNLFEIKGVDKEMEEIYKILEDMEIKIGEIVRILNEKKNKFEIDEEEIKEKEKRLSIINSLKKKHGTDLKGVIENVKKFKKELETLSLREEKLKEKEEKIKEIEKELNFLSEKISKERKRISSSFEKEVINEIKPLGFSYVDFKVEITEKELDEKGKDKIRFLISTNKGIKPFPLSKVASGGELSRIMLGIKSLLAKVDSVSGLLFDEIDVGIGGKVAEEVGKKMKKIGKERQVICITHLPQIAALADTHFKVEKIEKEGKPFITVKKLSKKERLFEIARMLAGERITETSIKHAEVLLEEGKKIS
ncbi:MAG: DNA repair protein RecN [candidate division WOR-3 bacterium]